MVGTIEAAKDRESATENLAGVAPDAAVLPTKADTFPVLFLDERLGLPSLDLALTLALVPALTLILPLMLVADDTLTVDCDVASRGGSVPLVIATGERVSPAGNPEGSENDAGNEDDEGTDELYKVGVELFPESALDGRVCSVCCCSN